MQDNPFKSFSFLPEETLTPEPLFTRHAAVNPIKRWLKAEMKKRGLTSGRQKRKLRKALKLRMYLEENGF